ncbi:MAG TPA: lasso peptide biosynthesis B2 protein [Terriglobales bacterium]|nr:lasso peptide biosynthesis B2 protein [Terriglobales bacterium]
MWEPLKRYKALDRESQRIFWRAAFLLPSIRISLRMRGYNATFAVLQSRASPIANDSSPSLDRVRKISRSVRSAVHHAFLRFTCLEESLALWYVLRKQGIASQLRIGVRKSHGKFEAHAWVEYAGEAVNQPEAAHLHYAAFEQEFSEPPAEQP